MKLNLKRDSFGKNASESHLSGAISYLSTKKEGLIEIVKNKKEYLEDIYKPISLSYFINLFFNKNINKVVSMKVWIKANKMDLKEFFAKNIFMLMIFQFK